MTEQIITFDDVEKLMRKVPKDVPLTFVGGQALGFWATVYYPRFKPQFDNRKDLDFTTFDIDIVASSANAEQCARAWEATIRKPEKWEETPNTAIVTVNIAGKGQVEIDFLDDYLKPSRIRKAFFSQVELSEDKPIYILGPFTVFLSKLANTILLKRNSLAERGQLLGSILIVKCFLTEKIQQGELHTVYRHIDLLLHIANNIRMGRGLYKKYNIDILTAIPDDLTALDERFLTHNYQQKLKKVLSHRNRHKRDLNSLNSLRP